SRAEQSPAETSRKQRPQPRKRVSRQRKPPRDRRLPEKRPRAQKRPARQHQRRPREHGVEQPLGAEQPSVPMPARLRRFRQSPPFRRPASPQRSGNVPWPHLVSSSRSRAAWRPERRPGETPRNRP